MTVQAVADLKLKFESGDQPTGQDYIDLIDTLLDIESQWPEVLSAADASNLTNLSLPDPLPALDAEELYNVIPDEWIDLAQYNPSYADPTSFVLNGDHTARFVADKLIRLTVDGSYEYTTPALAVYAAGPDVTTVTINNPMSEVTLTAVSVSVFSPFKSGGAISPAMVGIDDSDVISIAGTVALNALTLTLYGKGLGFRSADLADGIVNLRYFSDLSLIVPDGATLGTVAARQSRLILLAIDNAGTIELAIVNLAGGNNLDETSLITTVAIDATADSNNVIYSTAARANVPFRVVGVIESTQAIAGTWATDPSKIQGVGGNAFTAMNSLGYSQTWQDFFGVHVANTTYYNITSKPIFICIAINASSSATSILSVDGIDVGYTDNALGGYKPNTLTAIVPSGSSYLLLTTNAILIWAELR